MKFDTIDDINSNLIKEKLSKNAFNQSEISDFGNLMHRNSSDGRLSKGSNSPKRPRRNNTTMKHTELQKYLKTLQKSKNTQIKNILSNSHDFGRFKVEEDYKSNFPVLNRKNSNYSNFEPSSSKRHKQISISMELKNEDDVYLIHPNKFMPKSNFADSPKNNGSNSVSSLGMSKKNSLKPKIKKKIVNAIEHVLADKDTFIKFYRMKEPMLPVSITFHCYTQDGVSKWRPSAREGSLMHYKGKMLEEDQFIVFGGISNEVLKELNEMTVSDYDTKVNWEKHTQSYVCLNEYGKEANHVLDLGRGGISQ